MPDRQTHILCYMSMPPSRLTLIDLPDDILERIGREAHPGDRQALRATSRDLHRSMRAIPLSRTEFIGGMLREAAREPRTCVQVTCAIPFGPHPEGHRLAGWQHTYQALYADNVRFFPTANQRWIVKHRFHTTSAEMREERHLTMSQAMARLKQYNCTARVVAVYRLPHNPRRPNFPYTTTVGKPIYRKVFTR